MLVRLLVVVCVLRIASSSFCDSVLPGHSFVAFDNVFVIPSVNRVICTSPSEDFHAGLNSYASSNADSSALELSNVIGIYVIAMGESTWRSVDNDILGRRIVLLDSQDTQHRTAAVPVVVNRGEFPMADSTSEGIYGLCIAANHEERLR